MDSSEERDARAQSIFRAGNEALRRAGNEALRRAGRVQDGAFPYLCECGDERCFARLTLAREEYEAVRSHPRRFVVASGHEAGGRTLEERDGYSVIEKEAEAGEIAVETDPRRGEA